MPYTVTAYVRSRGAIGIFTPTQFHVETGPGETVKEKWFILFTDVFELHHFDKIVEE